MTSSDGSTMPACPGPDRNLRQPKFHLPPGSWDCQAHIFGPTDKYPLSPDRSYTPEELPLGRYIEVLDMMGFDRGVLVQGGAHGKDNGAMLDALARTSERLRGVAVIPPGRPHAELARMNELGVRGARMSTVVGGGVVFDKLPPLADEVAPMGWHVLLHFMRAHELLDLEEYLYTCPVNVVLDHLARITGAEGIDSEPFKAVLRLMETGNVWVKLSSLYRLSSLPYPHEDMLPMVQAVAAARPDRVLWGSNWPHPIHWGVMPNDADLVDLIPLWIPDPAMRERLLVKNPLDLYA